MGEIGVKLVKELDNWLLENDVLAVFEVLLELFEIMNVDSFMPSWIKYWISKSRHLNRI